MPLTGPGELTVRRSPSGGPLAGEVRGIPTAPDAVRPITLFVHGYNNDYAKASNGYEAMLQRLDADMKIDPVKLNDVWLFYWPGDLAEPIASPASYPWKVGRARKAARLLAAYLLGLCRSAGRRIEVAFVAHSLGTRILFEAVTELDAAAARGEPAPRITGIVLMAAAVPERYCFTGGRFGVVHAGRFEANLYSRKDKVLRWLFPAGQTAARDGFFPTAVGYLGNPLDRWGDSRSMGYGHGDYWRRPGSAYHVAKVFGRVAPRRPRELDVLVNELPATAEVRTAPLRESVPSVRRRTTLGPY